MSQEDYVNLISLPQVVPKILLLLDLNDLVNIGNKQAPTLENTELIGKPKISQPLEDWIYEWIDEWRKLFDTMMTPYKLSMGIGNRQNCVNRMKIFIERVGNDKEKIFSSTRAYLKDCISKNRLAKMPEYFILPQSPTRIESRDIKTGDLYEWYIKSLESEVDLTSYDI
jgi:hypothetical protein